MEPVFKIRGDQNIISEASVNLELLTDEGTRTVTVLHKGKEYAVDPGGALRYHMYISYRDSAFCTIKVDNLHGKVKGTPLNDIHIKSKDGKVVAIYVPFEGAEANEGFILQPANIFFADSQPADAEKQKQKFTAMYNNR